MSATLKPCPFCGGTVSFHEDAHCDGCHNIWCKACNAGFDFGVAADPKNEAQTLDDLRTKIIPLWNRRADLEEST
jgi:hypothetical protein